MASEVVANLEKFISDLDPVYLTQAMNKACALVRNEAVNLAPHRTGALQRSIDFQVGENGTEGVIYTNLEYAPYVEVGTGIYATKGGGRETPWAYKDENGWHTTRGQRAQPFLEPAVQRNTSDIRDCFEGLF